MLFVEFRFFWFFLAVFSVYWSLRENRSRKIWLLICSYFFYAAWNWKFLFLLMGSSALDYFVGRDAGADGKSARPPRLADSEPVRESRHDRVLQVLQLLHHFGRGASSRGSVCRRACTR